MFGGFDNIFHVCLIRGFQKIEEVEFSWWLFEGRLRQGKNVLPNGLNWLCYFAGSSKSHCENSISFILLESPYQADMKNVVKSSKHFSGYFNILETHSELSSKIGLYGEKRVVAFPNFPRRFRERVGQFSHGPK